jgi:hypothetical protein
MPTPERVQSLSKTRFVAGCQCHKLLWWKTHEPDATELIPDEGLKDLFEQGHQVGAAARAQFPGGVLMDYAHNDPARIPATREAIKAGAPAIFEASFFEDRVFAAIDVLERTPDGWVLIEVKSTNRAKPEHIPDAAVQTHIVRKAGLSVKRVELMHLNPDYVHPGGGDLFVRTDVKAEVEAFLAGVPNLIARQLAVVNGPLPDTPIGPHCWQPRDCAFRERCWHLIPNHISTLAGVGDVKAWAFMQRGIHGLDDVPPGEKVGAVAKRQLRAVARSEIIVEPSLREALEPLKCRLGLLDFETVARAIPVWPGLHPWGSAAAQFSYHEMQPNGTYTHSEYLAEGPGDPREEVALALLKATHHADRVAMYTTYERQCIQKLAAHLPSLADDLHALDAKLIDLHPVVKNHVYHPGFGGSFSLKDILTPLAGADYRDIAIEDGGDASVQLARLLFLAHLLTPEERDTIRHDLKEYCRRDTEAMVKVLEKLRELASSL